METIKVGAFQLPGQKRFYGATSGNMLQIDYTGYVMKYYADGPTLFKTEINKYGERTWQAIGNNPKANIEWI